MKKLVNKRSGKEIATGEWENVIDAVNELSPELDEETYCCCFGANEKGDKIWHSYFDLALEVKISYREYKNKYSWCDTKRNSYNPTDKTVTVYKQDKDQRI